jgi:serine/threonine protein phosphatase PrpC
MPHLRALTMSITGRSSQINEDCFLSGSYVPDSFSLENSQRKLEYATTMLTKQTSCFAVFAGIGGKLPAEIAARIAADELKAETPRMLLLPVKDTESLIQRFARRTHEQIEQASQSDKSLAGMGAAFACICLRGDSAVVLSLGDCRVYQYRVGQLHRLSLNERTSHYFGMPAAAGKPVCLSSGLFQLRDNDRFLVCSSGLAEAVDETAIKNCLEIVDLQQAIRQLTSLALEHGSQHSVTGTMIAWSERDLDNRAATSISDLAHTESAHARIEHTSKVLNTKISKDEKKPVIQKGKPESFWKHFPVWAGYLGLALAILLALLIWFGFGR